MKLLLFSSVEKDYYVAEEAPASTLADSDHENRFFPRLKERIKRTYCLLRERFDYQENVCAALRHATDLEIVHSGTVEETLARRKFLDFLKTRRAKHTRWLLIDVTLALLGSIMTPIPGPNVFFLYPAARSVSHFLAVSGTRSAGQAKLRFKKDALITELERNLKSLDEKSDEIKELEVRYEIRNLEYLLRKI